MNSTLTAVKIAYWGVGWGRMIVIKRRDVQKMTKMVPCEMIRTHLH